MKLGHVVLVVLLSGALAIPISAALARIGIEWGTPVSYLLCIPAVG
jgi:hypothetical protein